MESQLARVLFLRDAGEYSAARAAVDALLLSHAALPEVWNNDGLLRMDYLDIEGAKASFHRVLELSPSHVAAHFNLGLAYLIQGDFQNGWREYEWRTRAPGYADYANYPFGVPRWAGEPLAGRSVLVHAEQGFGDTLQFARFLSTASELGAQVDLFCQPSLCTVLAGVKGVRLAFSSLDQQPSHDFHAPIMDLGARFLPDSAVPRWTAPYISAAPHKIESWRARLSGLTRPVVGLVWSGNVTNPSARRRSMTAQQFQPLMVDGASFVSLQLPRSNQLPATTVFDAAADISDWEDTAAILANLDMLISVDTAVAHMAAGMGKPVWLLLHYSSDWRWGVAGEATPWYPSMRLLRQATMGDWGPVLAQTRSELQKLVSTFR